MSALKVSLYCSGCGETFTGSIGLVGSVCGEGRIVRADLCERHGAPLFPIPELGLGGMACRHCLENVCDTCEEPESLCHCEAS